MRIKTWIVLTVSFLSLQTVAQADTVITTVFNVIESKRTESILILSGIDGKVYKTHKDKENLERMKSLKGKVVKLDFQESGNESIITSIRAVAPNEVNQAELDLNHFRYNQLRQFAPTDLGSLEKATEVFKGMINDGDRRFSQCFKRAHMWSFDMWSNLGITSEKIFMFYTQRYITINEFKWWFHVSPLVTAGGESYVMDGTFMSKPVTVKEWTKFFMKTDKLNCPEITTYQEFRNNQWNRLCYTMRTTMYHFRPADIEARDTKGVNRNHWVIDELQDARRAFKNWGETYEGIDSGNKPIKF